MPTSKPKTAKRKTASEWEEIEPHYRAGVRALKDIGQEFDVSDAAIIKHARNHGWERDLRARIRVRAEAKVSAASVSATVSARKRLTEEARVEAESEIQSRIQISHRKDIPLKRELGAKLFAEIEGLTDGPELIEQLILALQQGDLDKLAEVARKVASLPGRIKGFADLVGSYKTLVAMEREAFGITSTTAPGEEFTEIVRRIVRG